MNYKYVMPVVLVAGVGGGVLLFMHLYNKDQERLDSMDSKDKAEVMKARAYSGAITSTAALLSGPGPSKNNKGLKKMIAINKSAKSLQRASGYEKRKVKVVEVKTVEKMMPKLSWKKAQRQAANLYKSR